MYTEARKIQLIAEVLKLNSSNTLEEIERVIKKSAVKAKLKKNSVYDFLGVLNKREAVLMKQAIEE